LVCNEGAAKTEVKSASVDPRERGAGGEYRENAYLPLNKLKPKKVEIVEEKP
jgi:hypothetical protein